MTNISEDKDAVYILNKDLSKQEIKKVFSSKKEKVSFSWKPIIKYALKNNIDINTNNIFDIKIAGWMLNPDAKNITLESISKEILDLKKETSKKQEIVNLHKKLKSEIKNNNLYNIYYKIEMPLIRILADMEVKGIKVSKRKLNKFKKDVEKDIKETTNKIYKLAGRKFNINSPQQVGEVLFKDLNIRSGKKTATGKFSTSEEVLRSIKKEHPIVKQILIYRNKFKTLAGFISPLISSIDETGRIHTTFIQTNTATGRLSSENPNLQNIPTKKTEEKNKIRSSFVVEKGMKMISFDYSQLELRLLAHASNDKTLKDAIIEGKDIHALTASHVFNEPIESITEKQRSIAKTLNFGIIYGMGKLAFSKQSGLSVKESEKLINKYFSDFPNIKKWQKEVIEFTNKNGFVMNKNGRIRLIKKGGYMDRAIINMPIQSLGADIIKKGMIEIDKKARQESWADKGFHILLSIHDELLIEVDENMLELTIPKIKDILENIDKDLTVPLAVDVKQGKNWGNLKKYELKS